MDEERLLENGDGVTGVVSWVERVTRRSLGDVRIHDSAQAGQLARRLGARAFAAGRDVYVRPELVEPMTPEGAALLAHELYHVAEQSGGDVTQEAVMPLLRPLQHSQQPQAYRGGAQGYAINEVSAPASHPVGQTAPSLTSGPTPIQRDTGGQSGSEATAEAVAGAAAQEAQGGGKKRKAAPPNPEIVADIVYKRIAMELVLEKERGAY